MNYGRSHWKRFVGRLARLVKQTFPSIGICGSPVSIDREIHQAGG